MWKGIGEARQLRGSVWALIGACQTPFNELLN